MQRLIDVSLRVQAVCDPISCLIPPLNPRPPPQLLLFVRDAPSWHYLSPHHPSMHDTTIL